MHHPESHIGSYSCLTIALLAGFSLNNVVRAEDAPASVQTTAASRTPPPPPARGPALDLALEAAQTAVATCTANGYKVGVTVVDSAGVAKVVLAADGASPRAVDSGVGKAFTAITFKTSSAAVAKRAEADKEFATRLTSDPKQRARAGALPLIVAGEVIGAIGVGGAPGGEKDEACAAAGLDKVKDRLK
jgi:uncharacterized protein GlcG (DUF336 family)